MPELRRTTCCGYPVARPAVSAERPVDRPWAGQPDARRDGVLRVPPGDGADDRRRPLRVPPGDGADDRRRPLRVGHKGADAISPGNRLESFDAALTAGVDMLEFDVLPRDPDDPASELVLAHDAGHLDGAPTLAAALAHLCEPRFAHLRLDVDMKQPGYETRVADALREHGLSSRALVSTLFMRSLVALRAHDPEPALGWSVPRVRRDHAARPLLAPLAYGVLSVWRARLPGRAAAHLRAGRIDALMCHWRLVTPMLVRAVGAAGGELFVWTVDDAARIAALARLGVDGVITNDPRLFGARVGGPGVTA